MAILKKKLKEEDQMINDAAMQAPAPQPVAMPQMQDPNMIQDPAMQDPNMMGAPQSPALVPPQPGMIPTGWMWPQESAQADAMNTGDVNMANAAPGGGMVDNQALTNEEAQVVQEYRKWNKQKRLEALKNKLGARVAEASDKEEEVAAEGVEEKDLKEARIARIKAKIAEAKAKKLKEDEFAPSPVNVVNQDELGDPNMGDDLDLEGDELDMDDDLGNEEFDIEEDLKDVAIDINQLFSDIGGDINEVLPNDIDDVEPSLEDDEMMEDDDLEGDDEMPSNSAVMSVMEKIKARRAEKALEEQKKARRAKIREKIAAKKADKLEESPVPRNTVDIKFPAGTPEPEVSADVAGNMVAGYAEKVLARRKLLAQLRAKVATIKENNLMADQNTNADRDALDKELGDEGMSVQSVIDSLPESRTRKSAVLRETSGDDDDRASNFVKRYNEKQQLDFKELLRNGLLG